MNLQPLPQAHNYSFFFNPTNNLKEKILDIASEAPPTGNKIEIKTLKMMKLEQSHKTRIASRLYTPELILKDTKKQILSTVFEIFAIGIITNEIKLSAFEDLSEIEKKAILYNANLYVISRLNLFSAYNCQYNLKKLDPEYYSEIIDFINSIDKKLSNGEMNIDIFGNSKTPFTPFSIIKATMLYSFYPDKRPSYIIADRHYANKFNDSDFDTLS